MPDEQSLQEKELQAAMWYVTHKSILRRVIIGLIIAVDAALLLYSLFGVGKDVFSIPDRRKQEFELLRAALPQGMGSASAGPQDLQLGGVELLQAGEVTDVLARVKNPNPQWYVRFEYVIGLGDAVERSTDGFLLPGEERPIVRTLRGATGTVVFNIENVSWRRINTHDIPDFETFRKEHLDFEVKDPEFLPSVVEGKGTVSRARFTLINKTAYSYFAPKFLVLLYRGSKLVGIQSAVADRFKTGETRPVEVSWFDRIGAVSNIEVVPEIDILDQNSYMQQ